MDAIVETGLSVIIGIWLLNAFITEMFDINIIGIIANKIKKWARDVDDPS